MKNVSTQILIKQGQDEYLINIQKLLTRMY